MKRLVRTLEASEFLDLLNFPGFFVVLGQRGEISGCC